MQKNQLKTVLFFWGMLSSFVNCYTFQNDKFITNSVTKSDLIKFANIYQNRPIKDNSGGMAAVSMFWVWYVTCLIQPELIIESGIWKGQSTWILEQAAPNAQIIAIDINLEYREYISPKVNYYNKDFSQIDFGNLRNKKVLAFFDDHQNAFLRIQQAKALGIQHLIFDDNYPPNYGSHLTLAHCLNLDAEASYLKQVTNLYVVLPNICGNYVKINNKFVPTEELNIDIKNKDPQIFINDFPKYRWTTYVELSETNEVTPI